MCFDNKNAEMTNYAFSVGKLPGLKGEPTEAQAKRTAVGWRAWKIKPGTEKGSNPVLVSMNNSAEWEPGKPMETHQEITTTNIGVGVHAFGSLEALLKQYPSAKSPNKTSLIVVGEILLWGPTAIHYDDRKGFLGKKKTIEGYRSQYGYPLKLWTPNSALQSALRDRYTVWVGRAFIPQMLADRKAV